MHLFISDLHLEENRPALTRAFLHFLEQQAPAAETLYLLGDIFDVWVGDDAMTPFHHDMAAALKHLADQGTQVVLMHGNRDFMLGRAFCQAAGASLLPDPSVITPYGKPILLMHGDLLCTQDVHYQRMRRILRNPVINFLLRNLPLKLRLKLAAKMRQASRSMTRKKDAAIVDVTQTEVVRIMQAHQVDTLIHGHTHRPAIHHFYLPDGQGEKPATRYVLGDWSDQQGWKLTLTAKGAELTRFGADSSGEPATQA